MFGFFKRRAEYEQYRKMVDDSLRVLFFEFPPGTLVSLRPTLNIERVTRGMFKRKDTTAKQCGVMIARTLVGTFFMSLSHEEKLKAVEGIDARDLGNRYFYAVAAMDHVARQLTDDIHGRLLLYQVAGTLKGMTQEEVNSWWGQNEVGRIADSLAGR